MDLPTRKLNLIAYLAQLQDENFIENIEQYILSKQQNGSQTDYKPFTVEDLISRVEESEQDYVRGNFKTQDDLEKISEKW